MKITNIGGTVQADLPVARTLKFGERLKSGELKGDDAIAAVVAFSEAVEWELEAGGISLEAYALLSGRTAVEAGTTPTWTYTLTGRSQASFPYVKIYGKALGAGIDDLHCRLLKCKVTGNVEGSLADGEFWVTKCKGIAIDDGSVGIFQFVQNETATTLPAA
ncbi:MAG: hypothetical protein NTU85_03490 [Candidatus Kaiserbacteria bacterium]|nr:hypothetical protein [Candidatus Kaiserbacteria bacterium]